MKKRYLLACLLIVSAIMSSKAQQFTIPNLTIPVIDGPDTLQNAWAGGLNAALISEIDMNMDGVKDLFMYDRANQRISTFINNGSTTGKAYQYDYRYASQFPYVHEWALLYDYDCDGKEDFFTLATCNCGIAVYRNISTTASGLQFSLISGLLLETNGGPAFNIFANALSVPAFSDIDNDGDMDILGYNSSPDGRVQYHRNYSAENGNACDSLSFKFENPTWGFFKLRIGGSNNVGCFGCRSSEPQNTPGPSVQFNVINDNDIYEQSSAAKRDDSNTSIFAIDLDGDNDKDLLIGDITASNTLMVCNGGGTTQTNTLMDSLCTDSLFPSYNTSVRIRSFTYHAYIDVDNDGIKDLLVTPERLENKKCVWYYKNMGTNSTPVFDLVADNFIVNTMIDVGEGASPVFFDYNYDGLPDMVVGNFGEFNSSNGSYRRRLALYKNTGNSSQAAFTLVTRDFAAVNSLLLDGPV